MADIFMFVDASVLDEERDSGLAVFGFDRVCVLHSVVLYPYPLYTTLVLVFNTLAFGVVEQHLGSSCRMNQGQGQAGTFGRSRVSLFREP
jgi:hypothetical protein